ncbi:DUF982 domain-containing protein [Falsirhodobacter sp. 1013]|uniref:DUF982 domain-containing protein n=1 Tax=Falsirhodobacter sp. 1013 TaxID=3417566 RepID=UPI003EB7011E
MNLWTRPIVFDDAPRDLSGVYSRTEDALNALSRWPSTMGREYRSAKAACEAAIAGRGSHAAARQAFLYAADEIGMFARV